MSFSAILPALSFDLVHIERLAMISSMMPPYSPDLNPIEMAISEMKNLLRSQAERTVEGLYDGIGKVLHAITPADAIAYITHCGYAARNE